MPSVTQIPADPFPVVNPLSPKNDLTHHKHLSIQTVLLQIGREHWF